jgi:hypothetical protein
MVQKGVTVHAMRWKLQGQLDMIREVQHNQHSHPYPNHNLHSHYQIV